MMSQGDSTLQSLLYGGIHGDGDEGLEARIVSRAEEMIPSANQVSPQSPPTPTDEPMVCAGCGGRVRDRFVLLAAGRSWHEACLRCSQCHCELQTHPSLYCREGSIYCQQDYCRLFSVGRCARCSQPIPSSAMVMRSGEMTFHPECFCCQECEVTLTPGNLYYMQGESLFCQSHYHDDRAPETPPPLSLRLQLPSREAEGEESVSSPEPRLDDAAVGRRARRRTKRIRTCFRSEQLRALEACFARKHNPDGRDWGGLAHRTGLPKRVLQVWFQNARAKLRRSLSADESQSNSPGPPPRADAMATPPPTDAMATPPPPTGPCSQQPRHHYPTSTIDQSELSLLTAPLDEAPPQSPAPDQSTTLRDLFFLDYRSQGAPGLSPGMTFDLEECRVGAGQDGDSDDALKPYFS